MKFTFLLLFLMLTLASSAQAYFPPAAKDSVLAVDTAYVIITYVDTLIEDDGHIVSRADDHVRYVLLYQLDSVVRYSDHQFKWARPLGEPHYFFPYHFAYDILWLPWHFADNTLIIDERYLRGYKRPYNFFLNSNDNFNSL